MNKKSIHCFVNYNNCISKKFEFNVATLRKTIGNFAATYKKKAVEAAFSEKKSKEKDNGDDYDGIFLATSCKK